MTQHGCRDCGGHEAVTLGKCPHQLLVVVKDLVKNGVSPVFGHELVPSKGVHLWDRPHLGHHLPYRLQDIVHIG
jgi:hypothetical protein